ncbi:NADH:ubiquinone oxidoreductase subunit 5 (subunit L)/multisubunit Na+/H+ antiporter MnhA subunit [Friedmanniella endophytica]|uniref:NADH:ubiquinone oxidoreductase subunit 5 (Subunit L)/multisubunit Na+/H+ antiporter MnhA subunit n=1 Tax=Microlunatus kandeliicorticis TaxID=1759536 RepID=A0A7W3P4F8_9ACTN|nr:proton-conducting transporter membrane subunit [Microlunatus kandeliicorticis]MBA8792884.1 NADH:ubiquinone oxidoreductase subunit 5 (subunit L)/multisubunit Na+/H+ antiporter MnhA subunit [Microlunatus kandeliicorticis]
MNALLWLVPGLPAAAGAVLALSGVRSRRAAVTITLTVAALTLVLTTGFAVGQSTVRTPFLAKADLALGMDPLAGVVGVAVVVVAVLVLVFAGADVTESPARFGGLMLLFVAAVLTTVAARTLPTLILGWEVMGATSYALIGFDWRRPAAVTGGVVAFVTTRTADLGLYLAAGAALAGGGTLDLARMSDVAEPWRTVVAAGIAAAAIGKAAQLPFTFWISRAMEGPSPVSALLHSAAMVAMGGYLLLRVPELLARTPVVGTTVAWIGALTTVGLGLVALAQRDVKQVLAASTSAQLGFVVLAAGLGGVSAGVGQLLAHAATKALLFLAAGAWLSALGTRRLSALRGVARRWPLLGALATVGLLSLAGIAPLSLWAGKEGVLAVALSTTSSRISSEGGWPLYLLGLLGTALSAAYAGRVLQIIWSGRSPETDRWDEFEPGTRRIEPAMWPPLILLALAAVALGVLALPAVSDPLAAAVGGPHPAEGVVELIGSAGLALVVTAIAWRRTAVAERRPVRSTRPTRLLLDWFGLERAARAGLVAPVDRLAGLLARFDDRMLDAGVETAAGRTVALAGAAARFDRSDLDGLVEGLGRAVRRLARLARRPQTGQIHQYYLQSAAVVIVVAVLLIVIG